VWPSPTEGSIHREFPAFERLVVEGVAQQRAEPAPTDPDTSLDTGAFKHKVTGSSPVRPTKQPTPEAPPGSPFMTPGPIDAREQRVQPGLNRLLGLLLCVHRNVCGGQRFEPRATMTLKGPIACQ
jgi:hypothetical protein